MASTPDPLPHPLRKTLITGLVLGAVMLVSVGLLVLIQHFSQARIQFNAAHSLIKTLNEIIPANAYTNNIFHDTIKVQSRTWLGSDATVVVYRARTQQKPVAVVFSCVAPNGYSGNIRLLVGIYITGRIAGVRVLEHHETPGLGDKIERLKSDWILGFTRKSLDAPAAAEWTVKRDGGAFDAFTGATVTPRAVVQAVRKALDFFHAHQETLLNAPTDSVLML